MLGCPTDGLLEHTIGVDELLQHPVKRVACRGEVLQRAHKEGVGELRFIAGAGKRAVARLKGRVEKGVQALGRRLHAKTAAKNLQPAGRERASVGQADIACSADVGDGCEALLVLGVAFVVGAGLGGHAAKGVGVDLRGAGRDVRDAAASEARGNALGIKAQVAKGEEAAVALAERGPAAPAKLGEAQVLKVAHDGAGEEALEELRLLGRATATLEGTAAHALAAAGAALVG